jgi:signal transduction histidine kinase/ligand-binding sensor domain-containing protein
MLARKQVLWSIRLKHVIASVFLVLLILYSAPMRVQAQSPELPPFDPTRLVFETVTGNYGNIYNVIQDKDGFLWLAGINGAIKYNGYEAETIYSGDTISALFEDSEGLIWMNALSGLVVYDKKTGKISTYVSNPDDPNALSGVSVTRYQRTQMLTEDRDGYIWIGTVNGLNKFDKKSGKFTAYKSKADDSETLLDNDVWSVLTAKDGSLWVGTATGLHKFDPQTGKVLERYAANVNDPNALHGKFVEATVEDNEGIIWVGTTAGGLNRLDPNKKTFSHYTADAAKPSKIANNFIYRLAHFNSSPDLIWITTVDGLSILDKRTNTITNYVYDAEKADKGGLGGKVVHTIIQDKSGILWLVVNEHGFLQKIDPGADQFGSILRNQNPKQGFVDVSCPLRLGPDGNIWVTEVTTGIARVDPKTGSIINHFLHNPQKPEGFPAHIEDFDFEPRQKEIIWVVAQGVVVEYNWNTQTVVNRYSSGTQSKIWPVWTDKRNPDLLYGSVWGEGLLKFNKRTGQAKIFTPDPAHPKESLSGTGIRPLMPGYYQTEDNQIWLIILGVGFDLFDLNTEKVVRKHFFNKTDFASKDFEANISYIDSKGRFWMGANQYDPASETFTSFRDLYGCSYPGTPISSLTQDKQGLLWAAGKLDGMLSRFNPETGEVKVFTGQDGVSPGLACVAAPVTLPDGQIWMAGTGGVTYFHPDQIVNNPYHPPVYLTKLTQGGKPLAAGIAPEWVKDITLNWYENFFEFEMSALSYRHPEKNQYQYMLEGVDKDWYNAGTKRNGRYSGLPDGTYTLRVRGSNNDGVWSKQEAMLKVTVIGPFWRRTWFLLLVGLAVVGSVAGGVLRRIRAKEAQRRAAEERKRDLKRQIAERTAQLEAANKELEAFSYSVSHDLRAPLRHIVGFMELLEKKIGTALDEKSRHYMDVISEAIKKMGVLIDDLLSISRMGRHALSFQDVDLATLTSDVIRDLEPDFAGRDIKWQIGDLPVVSGDATLLRMVMDNLIANALKFTRPRQQAQIEIGSLPDQDSEAVIFVRDNGVGFDMAYVDKLFSVFQRLHHKDEFEGTGIGLATVHRIVARHGGRIWTEGKLDQGATFYFSLPQKQQGANHANP